MERYYEQPVFKGKEIVGTIFAEVTPSSGLWLKPNVKRWWFEIHGTDDKIGAIGYQYEKGGSGGAYSLRACLNKASVAVDKMIDQVESAKSNSKKEK